MLKLFTSSNKQETPQKITVNEVPDEQYVHKEPTVVNVKSISDPSTVAQEAGTQVLSNPEGKIINSTNAPLQVIMVQPNQNLDTNKPVVANSTPELNSSGISAAKISASTKPVTKKSGFGFMFGAKAASAATAPSTDEIDAARAEMDAQLNALKEKLTKMLPFGEAPVRCFIERDKGMMGLNPTFRLMTEATDTAPEKFLMSAKKNNMTATTYFLISTDATPSDKESDGTLGKLRGNTDGSQYLFYDSGDNPEKVKDSHPVRKELGLLRYPRSNVPTNMNCYLPGTLADGASVCWQPRTPEQSMDRAVDEGRLENLFVLTNKMGDNLDYKGRVTEQSTKNFQLICSVTGDEPVLLFGKSRKDRFAMDVRYPLSLYQAFLICITVMDKTSNNTFKPHR